MLGRILGFDTAEILAEAYHIQPPPPSGIPVTVEELRSLIVDALREELDRRGMPVRADPTESS